MLLHDLLASLASQLFCVFLFHFHDFSFMVLFISGLFPILGLKFLEWSEECCTEESHLDI